MFWWQKEREKEEEELVAVDRRSIRVLPTFCINERKREKVCVCERERRTCKADLSLSFDVVFSSSVRMSRSGQSICIAGEKLQRKKSENRKAGQVSKGRGESNPPSILATKIERGGGESC